MATYSSRDAIAHAVSQRLDQLAPFLVAYTDAMREVYAAFGRPEFPEAHARFDKASGRFYAAWQRAGGDLAKLAGS